MSIWDLEQALRAHELALTQNLVDILERNLPLNYYGTMPNDEKLQDRIRALRAKLHGTTEPVTT